MAGDQLRIRLFHVIPSVGAQTGGPARAIVEICNAIKSVAPDAQAAIATTTCGLTESWVAWLRNELPDDTELFLFSHHGSHTHMVSLPLLKWLHRHISDYQMVHIHALFHPMSSAAALLARWKGIPYILRPLGTLSHYTFTHRRRSLKYLYYRAIERGNIESAAAIHFTTLGEQAKASRLGAKMRPVVVPLPFNPPTMDTTSASHRFQLLFLSRLDRKKGLDVLLPAFARVHSELPTSRLVIAGSGDSSYEKEIRALTKQHSLESCVEFVGFVDGSQRLELLRSSSLFVLPSRDENFGLAVVEAMAVGLPVVVTHGVDLSPDIERAGAGVVVELGVIELAGAIRDLALNSSKRVSMGKAGRDMVASRFAPRRVGCQLVGLYKGCLSSDTMEEHAGCASECAPEATPVDSP